ncbi:UNVERIFIED_CONTAM: hypothetical protein K2H54_060424 [Gekko kuhli]
MSLAHDHPSGHAGVRRTKDRLRQQFYWDGMGKDITRGKQYILTIVDFATRWPEAVALSRIDATTVCQALADVFARWLQTAKLTNPKLFKVEPCHARL